MTLKVKDISRRMKRRLKCSRKIKKDAPIKDIIGCTTSLLIKPCFSIISLAAAPRLPRMYWMDLRDIFKPMGMLYMIKSESEKVLIIYIAGGTHEESLTKL